MACRRASLPVRSGSGRPEFGRQLGRDTATGCPYTADTILGLAPKMRDRKPARPNPLHVGVDQPEAEVGRLEKELATAKSILEIQRRVVGLLGLSCGDLKNPHDACLAVAPFVRGHFEIAILTVNPDRRS